MLLSWSALFSSLFLSKDKSQEFGFWSYDVFLFKHLKNYAQEGTHNLPSPRSPSLR